MTRLLILFLTLSSYALTINYPNDTIRINSWQNHKNTIYAFSTAGELANARASNNGKPCQVQLIDTFTVSSAIVIDSNMVLDVMGRGFFKYATGGSLTVNGRLGSVPSKHWLDTNLPVTLDAGSTGEVRSEWFGVKANGIKDDTKAFRQFAASVGGPNQPKHARIQAGRIRITKTIYWSDWKSSAKTSYPSTESFTWNGETKYWGGEWSKRINNLVLTGSMSGAFDSLRNEVWFDGSAAVPMFVFIGGRSCVLNNIMLNGTGTTKTASEGIFLTGGSEEFTMSDCLIRGCIRNIRLGNMINQATDPVVFTDYEALNPADPVGYGGWQVDNIIINGGMLVSTDSTQEYRCGISMESAQTINLMVNNTFIRSYGYYAIDIFGGFIQLQNVAFLASGVADLHVRSDCNTNGIKMFGGHTESEGKIAAGVKLLLTDRISTGSSTFYSFNDVTGGSYLMKGNGILNINGGTQTNIALGQNTNAAEQQVSVSNCNISGLIGSEDSASAKKVTMTFKNCKINKIDGSSYPWGSWFTYHKRNTFENCQFSGAFDQSVLNLNHVATSISTNDITNNSQIALGTYVSNMNTIGGSENELQMRWGAFKKDDSLVSAGGSKGGMIQEINQTNYTIKRFPKTTTGNKITPVTIVNVDTLGKIKGYDTTTSTSTTTGALIVSGGIGAKNAFIGRVYDSTTPEMFGAKGDGLTDDTQAWRNLISSLPGSDTAPSFTVKGRSRIFCNPKKFYKITDSLDFSEKWNLSIIGAGRNFSRSTDSIIPTFGWYGGTNKSVLFFHYNYGLNIENISINGRGVAGVVGVSMSKPTVLASIVKFVNVKNLDVSNCDIGLRIGGSADQDDAAIIVEGGYYSNNTSSGIYLSSGNMLVTMIGNHVTNNGYAPTGTNKGCNVYFGGGQVKMYGYESAGSTPTAPTDADIYQVYGGLSIYSAWSDTYGKFLFGGSNSEGGVIKHIRHYAGGMTDVNTPTSIEVTEKTTLEGCYLFGDVVARSGTSGNITDMGGNQFVSGAILGTKRPDSGIGRYKGDLVTTYNALLSINPTGNASRIMAGGGNRLSYSAKNTNAFLGLFNKDVVECLNNIGSSGFTITGANSTNGSFEANVNCYSTDALINFKGYSRGYGNRYSFGNSNFSILNSVMHDTTNNSLGANFNPIFRVYGTSDTNYPTEFVMRPPVHNGANTFNSGSFWRGGILFDSASNHLLLSRHGSNTFKKVVLENDTITINKVASDSVGSKYVTTDSILIKNATNGVKIDSNNGVLLSGTATCWDDIRVAGTALRAGTTAPTLGAFGPSGSLRALLFESGKHQEAHVEIQMPHNWKLGSRIYPHVHWTPTNATAGNVVWELEYAWKGVDSVFGAPSNMASDAAASSGTAWKHTLTKLKEGGNDYIDGTGRGLSSMIVCRLHRNAGAGSDNLSADVALLEFDIHYEVDGFGSKTETAK